MTEEPFRPASPVCLLNDLDADGVPTDPDQVRDVARWRQVTRERLLALRAGLTPAYRFEQTQRMIDQLELLLSAHPPGPVGAYWPIRSEPDLRDWMRSLAARGIPVLLPVSGAVGEALTFREWRPGIPLQRGPLGTRHPAGTPSGVPSIVLAPLVGFDRAGYRLGYGGGFFDRTLAQLSPAPLAIGVGFPETELASIYPQPHDRVLDWIVTGAAVFKKHAG